MRDVIDLNEVWTAPPRFDLDTIRDRLAAIAPDWLPQLFPHARLARDRRSLRCADLSGRAPRGEGSCLIHLDGPYAGWASTSRPASAPGRSTSSTMRLG